MRAWVRVACCFHVRDQKRRRLRETRSLCWPLRAQRLTNGCVLSPVAFERHAQGGRCNFLLHQPRNTDVVEKFFCRVDVTVEFPFLATKLTAYYDR